MQSDSVGLFISAWRQMTSRLPSPVYEEDGGIACCFCDAPNLFLNLWIQSQPAQSVEQLDAMLTLGQEKARSSAYPIGSILRKDWLPTGWETEVQKYGLTPMVPMTSMESDHILPPRREPPSIEIFRIGDDKSARDLAMLNAAAYAMPEELFECIATKSFWPSDCYGYVGYVDGHPVSSAAALSVHNTVYIALVATAPDQQGKGYAETVMRHAIVEGQKGMGWTRTTLHASEAGKPLYQAMGYSIGPEMVLVGPETE